MHRCPLARTVWLAMSASLCTVRCFRKVSPFEEEDVSYYGNKQVQEGDGFLIVCFLDAKAEVSWTKDGLPLSEVFHGGYSIIHRMKDGGAWSSLLRFHKAEARHAGRYSCSSRSSSSHEIKVLVYQQSAQQLTDTRCYHLIPNETPELRCDALLEAGGDLPQNVIWYKNGKPVAADARLRVVRSRLIIAEATQKDAGVYVCEAGVPSSGPSRIFGVYRVITPIRIEPLPSSVVSRKGSGVRVTCNVHAVPKPKVAWYAREKQRIFVDVPPTDVERSYEGVHSATLVIQNASVEDSDEYTCSASHVSCEDFIAERSLQIYFGDTRIRTSEPFPGTGVTLDTTSPELRLRCIYPPDPYIRMRWLKDGIDVKTYPERKKYKVDPADQSLVITNPTMDDVDNYTCIAVGTDEKAVILVGTKVDVKLETSHLATFVEGKKLFLTCRTTGIPRPYVRWVRDNKLLPVLQTPRYSYNSSDGVFGNTLVIRKLRKSDSGTYACIADNGHSQDFRRFKVNVKGRFDALSPFLLVCLEVAVLLAAFYVLALKCTRRFAEMQQRLSTQGVEVRVPADRWLSPEKDVGALPIKPTPPETEFSEEDMKTLVQLIEESRGWSGFNAEDTSRSEPTSRQPEVEELGSSIGDGVEQDERETSTTKQDKTTKGRPRGTTDQRPDRQGHWPTWGTERPTHGRQVRRSEWQRDLQDIDDIDHEEESDSQEEGVPRRYLLPDGTAVEGSTLDLLTRTVDDVEALSELEDGIPRTDDWTARSADGTLQSHEPPSRSTKTARAAKSSRAGQQESSDRIKKGNAHLMIVMTKRSKDRYLSGPDRGQGARRGR